MTRSDAAPDALKPQPIETAPTDGTRVLAYWPDTMSGGSGWLESWHTLRGPLGSECWHSPFEYSIDYGPTHWLPLPPRPEMAPTPKNPAAFPVPTTEWAPGCVGINLRDYFAGQALAGELARQEQGRFSSPQDLATYCYRMAAAMLLVRET